MSKETNIEKQVTQPKKEKKYNNHHQHPVQKRLYEKFQGKKVIVYTSTGIKVGGIFTEHDQYTVAIEKDGDEIMFYKHGISFIRLALKTNKED